LRGVRFQVAARVLLDEVGVFEVGVFEVGVIEVDELEDNVIECFEVDMIHFISF